MSVAFDSTVLRLKSRKFADGIFLALLVAVAANAADSTSDRRAAVDLAFQRGVAYLLAEQDDAGAFSKQDGGRPNANAMTSLALMALGAAGHQPTDDTAEGKALRRGLEFILQEDRQDEHGYFGKSDGSRMYGHGIVTLMLSEMLGMGVDARQDALIRDRCQKALDLIVRAQKSRKKEERFRGGWRYQPDADDADLSVTVWQVMALRSAKNAGLVVPSEAIDQAVGYIKRTYRSERDKEGRILKLDSAFGYDTDRDPTFSTASAGLLSLQVCGQYDAEEIRNTAGWLRELKFDANERWFYYGIYYYAQGMYQRGGEEAERAGETVERLLLGAQKDDGSWSGRDEEGNRVYATSMALLSLSVRNHFMPIYQR
jgi:hypothetical protein